MERKKILIITGEVSGDLHGYNLAKSLLQDNKTEIHAIGGEKLSSLPINVLYDISDFSTIGITAFIPHIGKLIKANKIIKDIIKKNNYDMIIFIDNQGFNIPLGRMCKKLNIKTMYYFPPIVSVWDRKNAKLVPKIFNVIICPFKADHEIYLKNHGNSHFVGHPFIETVYADKEKNIIKNKVGLDKKDILIGICPGSRLQEMKTLLKPILNSVKLFSEKINAKFILISAKRNFDKYLSKNIQSQSKIELITKDKYNYLNACDLIVGASGSLAIEAAILETPMIVLYKISRLTYIIGKILIKTKYISWPNILLKKYFFPELLQNKVNAKNIVNNALSILNMNKDFINKNFEEIKNKLGEIGTHKKIKEIIYKELNNGKNNGS